jgi:hypothetical protein
MARYNRAVFTVIVWIVAGLNAVALFFLSLLAVGGDGSSGGIYVVRAFGFGWIALCTVLALWLCHRGRGALGVATALSTWPTGFAMAYAVVVAGIGWERIKPNSAVFEAACRGAATTFVAAPKAPVQSVAFDWEGKGPPGYTFFSVDSKGNVGGLRGGTGAGWPVAIRFTEGRCCRFEGPPRNQVRPYVRRLNTTQEYFGVTELTADTLVSLRSAPVPGREAGSSLTQFDVAVTDRRDGAELASMRYFLDARNRRGCVAGGVMDERAFVLKAVGVR